MLPKIFISYSHKDEIWKDRLCSHLGVLQNSIDAWDDRRIGAGEDWYKEIIEVINSASVAVLLVSADFLSSKFILDEEVPKLLEQREAKGLKIVPVLVRPCAWKTVKWLSAMQLRPRDGRPISGGNDYQIDVDMAAIVEEISTMVETATASTTVKSYIPIPPERISLAKLPVTGSLLIGREKHLETLDTAWKDSHTNVITIVAWGGVGKTTLVKNWLNNMEKDNYRGAEYVYGWSFYSQGSAEGKQTSADQFIANALKFFGDPNPDAGSPWDKGQRLAELVRKCRALIVLDGLEPLQNPPGVDEGRIKDPALQCFLKEVVHSNRGLCVITTRIDVEDIKDCGGVQVIELEQLSPQAGAEVLKSLGVKGTQDDMEKASHDFGGHALALTLLGTYLEIVYGGDIRKRDYITKLTDEENSGGHAKRVMRSYEKMLEGKTEVSILYMMGLFDRPADKKAIDALMFEDAINGLTSELQGIPENKWKYALRKLRKLKLLAEEDSDKSGTLDCHPLVREYFGEALKQSNPVAWKKGHFRLYEYYKSSVKQYPDTLEEMIPLFAAVAHGCSAGMHQEALIEVYVERIQRKNEHFAIKKLGAFGVDLAVLSGFFDTNWSIPVEGLSEDCKAFVLNGAGFDLRTLGRLAEAVQSMKASLEARIVQKNWKEAAISAGNLSGFYIAIGDIENAIHYARKGVEYADTSISAFNQMVRRTTLANALHQSGNIAGAQLLFKEAEEMQKRDEPKNPFLYSQRGFKYCELLLEQGAYDEVLERATYAIKIATRNNQLLDIALDNLLMGRGYEGRKNFTHAEYHINAALDGIRKAGQQQELPRGLLARAGLHRVCGRLDAAQRDLC